jgi:hypothetical protein
MLALAPALVALALAQPAPEQPPSPGGPAGSLIGGEVLAVGNANLAVWGGWPTLGFRYAQGLGPVDLGGELDLRWSTGEIDAVGLVRLPLWRQGAMALAFRGRLGLYLATGPSYGDYAHRNDTGLLAVPGLALSTAAGQATFSLGLDVRCAITSARSGGSFVAPLASAAIEVPVVGELTAGARLSFWRRWDSGGAPGALRSPESGAELVALLGYRIF